MEVSSFVPILECGLDIVHWEDEGVVQERGHALRDVEGAYSWEEILSDHEVVGRPMEVPSEAELACAGDQVAGVLLLVVPCGADGVVLPAPGGVP